MRSVLLISVRSDQGGGPRHMLTLARFLKSDGVLVYVASPMDPPYGPAFAAEFAGHFPLAHRRFSLGAVLSLGNWARSKGIGVVHSHGKGAGVYGRLLALRGFRSIHTFHGLHRTPGLRGLVSAWLERPLALLTAKLICVSESEKLSGLSHRLPPQKLVVVPTGMDFDAFKLPAGSGNTLGTLSRLDPHKGNLRLVRMMAHLPHHSLLIAGEGEERPQLEAEIKRLSLSDRVRLLGEVSDPLKFLSQIHVYVSASRGEGLPFAVLEAIAARRPIVASKVPGHVGLLPEDRLFSTEAEFVQRIERAPAQDTESLLEQTRAQNDLTASLEKICALY